MLKEAFSGIGQMAAHPGSARPMAAGQFKRATKGTTTRQCAIVEAPEAAKRHLQVGPELQATGKLAITEAGAVIN